MKWAILSDVHGNLEALQAVLEDLDREGVERTVFLGDAVGYGANPNECLGVLRHRMERMVAGNHDWGAVGRTDISDFNEAAAAAIRWTGRQLFPEHRTFLTELPLTHFEREIFLVHGSPYEPEEWHYIFTPSEAAMGFRALVGALAFVGHSHFPMVLTQDEKNRIRGLRVSEVTLDPERRYIINVGSVGQPRDGDPRAAYGLFDDVSRRYRLKRLPYDWASAQKKILQAGLPPFLARRLSQGV